MYVLNWFAIASLIEIENINLDPLSTTLMGTYVSFPFGVGSASGSQSCRVSYHSVTFDLWPLASRGHSRRKDQAQEPGKRHNWGPKSENERKKNLQIEEWETVYSYRTSESFFCLYDTQSWSRPNANNSFSQLFVRLGEDDTSTKEWWYPYG